MPRPTPTEVSDALRVFMRLKDQNASLLAADAAAETLIFDKPDAPLGKLLSYLPIGARNSRLGISDPLRLAAMIAKVEQYAPAVRRAGMSKWYTCVRQGALATTENIRRVYTRGYVPAAAEHGVDIVPGFFAQDIAWEVLSIAKWLDPEDRDAVDPLVLLRKAYWAKFVAVATRLYLTTGIPALYVDFEFLTLKQSGSVVFRKDHADAREYIRGWFTWALEQLQALDPAYTLSMFQPQIHPNEAVRGWLNRLSRAMLLPEGDSDPRRRVLVPFTPSPSRRRYLDTGPEEISALYPGLECSYGFISPHYPDGCSLSDWRGWLSRFGVSPDRTWYFASTDSLLAFAEDAKAHPWPM